MARPPDVQIAEIEKKIDLTEDYIRRLKKRVSFLTKRLASLHEKHGTNPKRDPDDHRIVGPDEAREILESNPLAPGADADF